MPRPTNDRFLAPHPATCDFQYTPAEVEFMKAVDEYRRRTGRVFPSCSELLAILLSLGYSKRGEEEGEG